MLKKKSQKFSRWLIFRGSRTSAISHKRVSLSGSGQLGWGGEAEEEGRTSSTLQHPLLRPLALSPSLKQGEVAGGTAGARLSVTANGEEELPGGTRTGQCVRGAVHRPAVSAHAVADKDTWYTVETQQSGLSFFFLPLAQLSSRLVSLISRSNHRLVGESAGR